VEHGKDVKLETVADDFLNKLASCVEKHYESKHFSCSDLVWDDLDTLLIQVDKENLIEFPFDFLHYIYNYYCGYALHLPQSSCYLSCDYPVTCCDCDCDMTISVTNVTPFVTL